MWLSPQMTAYWNEGHRVRMTALITTDCQADEHSHQSEWKKSLLCFHEQWFVGFVLRWHYFEILVMRPEILLSQKWILCISQRFSISQLLFLIIVIIVWNKFPFDWWLNKAGSQIPKLLQQCCITHNIHVHVTTFRRWTWCFLFVKTQQCYRFHENWGLQGKGFVRSCNQPWPNMRIWI